MINVEVNGKQIRLPPKSTLVDAIKAANAPYTEGTAIGILKHNNDAESGSITEYLIKTSKGDFKIELSGTSVSVNSWIHNFKDYKGIKVRWNSRNAVALGPFETDIIPEKQAVLVNQYDIVFGAGSFDPVNTYLIIALQDHSSEYGAPAEGAFGKVISNINVLNSLGSGDSILEIEPVIEWENTTETICTTDISTILEDDFRIFTYIEIDIDSETSEGAEHLFALVRNGIFNVDFASSSFISDRSLHGEICKYENFAPRDTGSVWVRTVGYGSGHVYIARDDRPSSIMHSVVGYVRQGIELVKMAEDGHKLMVNTHPEPLWLPGMLFSEAEEKLNSMGINITEKGYVGGDAVIVEHSPSHIIDVINSGSVEVTTVSSDKLVRIKLYDELAPKTLNFFRHAIELQFKPVGALPLIMTYEDTFIFKAAKDAETYKEILPENVPEGKVNAGELGVTNQAAKRLGMIGVKLSDDELFGPTGEKFESTNIIGCILDLEKLSELRKGDVMYVIESREDAI